MAWRSCKGIGLGPLDQRQRRHLFWQRWDLTGLPKDDGWDVPLWLVLIVITLVNASLNWASIVGIVLTLAALPGAVTAGFQIAFLLGRRADTSGAVILATIWRFLVLFARLLLLPLIGGIFFFQGWRLDPILQFGFFLLAAGYLSELVMSMVYEYGSWQKRKKEPEA